MIVEQGRLDGGVDFHDYASGSVTVGPEASATIATMRQAGHGYRVIANTLNARGVPTPSGRGAWWPSSVRHASDRRGWAAYMRAYRRASGG